MSRIARLGATFFITLAACLSICAGSSSAWAQEAAQETGQEEAKQVTNPLANNAEAIREGESQFRADCAFCHGLGARGGPRAPDLTRGVWVHGGSDGEIFDTIRGGVPGTLMPANDLSDGETWEIIAYLRSLNNGKPHAVHGDVKAGREIFFGTGTCSTCHMVHGKGGRLGPDLSVVGAARSPEFIAQKLRNPNRSLAAAGTDIYREWPIEYEAVTVTTKNNQQVRGVLRNEDTYSIQLMDLSENLHSYLKKDLIKVEHEHRTVMPAFDEETLKAQQLRDLLAYLDTLRTRPGEGQE